jgi:dethiobiotin synthetase
VVEGAGGLLSPISDHEYVADLARDLGYPLVIVAVNELGVINATLQTLIAAKACCAGVSIAGIVLTQLRKPGNDPSMVSNRAELARRCDRPVLAEAPYGERLDTVVDWFGLACG